MSTLLRLGAVGLILAGMVAGTSFRLESPLAGLWRFSNAPSFAIILGLLAMCFVTWFKWSEVREAFSVGLGHQPVSVGDAATHIAVLRTARFALLGAGGVGLFVGHVNMLSNMDDPTSIGPAFAVSLLTSLYAVVLAELFIAPMINGLIARKVSAESASKPSITMKSSSLVTTSTEVDSSQ